MTPGAPLLEARDLKVARGGSPVLDLPEFTLHANETVALIGPNGAGKSTLLLSLARLIDSTSGRLLYKGAPIPAGRSTIDYRRRLAMVFQEPLLFDTTVADNVAAGLKIRGMSAAESRGRVADALEQFRISHLADRAARKLSGGEAQRTSLARAFATRPEVILLDEPFAALDPPTRQALADDLELVIRSDGTAAVLTSHYRDEALRLADRMVVMEGGRIIQSAPPAEVLQRPVSAFVAAFAADPVPVFPADRQPHAGCGR